MRLQDRVALVTGGGSGFGRAIALRFAREARAWRSAAGDGRNCVCPAYIETDLNRDHLSRLRRTGEVQELERAHPLGLGGSPDDVATAALYLASDDARWNTGCCLPVDGGVSATI